MVGTRGSSAHRSRRLAAAARLVAAQGRRQGRHRSAGSAWCRCGVLSAGGWRNAESALYRSHEEAELSGAIADTTATFKATGSRERRARAVLEQSNNA
jgi:hypothetical protein